MHNINFSVLLEEIENDLGHLIKSTGTIIKSDLQVRNIQYPRKEIRSILFNLISNAIKYGQPGRSPIILVSTKLISEEILLEVEDNSSGIEDEHLPDLFNKYFRINRAVEGSGWGFFIVKQMVENRGGRIEVTSKVGKGSIFSVFLKPQK